MKYLNTFLWWCAGANIPILKKCPTDQAKYFGLGGTILFTALMASFAGGYAFFTAFKDEIFVENAEGIQEIAGYTYSSYALSICFALFWGALIFNLDRFIISSNGKGDGTSKITKDELQNAFPRLILAFIIGFVIAVPLELKVFEKEINTEIGKIINEERQKSKAGLSDIKDEIQRLKDHKIELDLEFDEIETSLKNDEDVIVSKASGSVASLRALKASQESSYNSAKSKYDEGKNRYYKYKKRLEDIAEGILLVSDETKKEYEDKRYIGNKARKKYGPIKDKWKNDLDKTNKELAKLGVEIDSRETLLKEEFITFQQKLRLEKERVDGDILELEKLLKTKQGLIDDTTKKFNGLMAQLIALDRLSIKVDTIYHLVNVASNKATSDSQDVAAASPVMVRQVLGVEKSRTPVWYAKWMISLLLICIEIAPILFKMMTESGPYDDRLEEIRYASEISKKKKMSDINEQINLELKLNNALHNNKMETEIAANKELLDTIAQAQAEIAQKAIESWKQDQIKKVSSDHSLVVQSAQLNGNGHVK